MEDINKLLLNPVRMRIIQELSLRPSITAAELCEKISDVPRTTIYRHIRILIENELLTVISEKKIRGSLERTIALNTSKIAEQNTLENASQNAFGFLMRSYAKFHEYFRRESPDPEGDRIFLTNSVLMMSDEEYDRFLSELGQLFSKYHFESDSERKARDISIISSPSDQDKDM